MKEFERRAKNKYRAKGKRLTLDFYPTESDLVEHLEKQPRKQSYIKGLIRADMEKTKAAQDIQLSDEDKIRMGLLSTFIDDEKRKEGFVENYKKHLADSADDKE